MEYSKIPASTFDDVKFLLQAKIEEPLTTTVIRMRCANDDNFQKFLSSRLQHAAIAIGRAPLVSSEVAKMTRSVQLSKILFLYIISPAITISGVSASSIALSLKTSLEMGFEASESPTIWKPQLLCWVLMTGAVTPQIRGNRVWFVRRVAQYIALYRVHRFDNLVKVLQLTAWSEGEFARRCNQVWKELEAINRHEHAEFEGS